MIIYLYDEIFLSRHANQMEDCEPEVHRGGAQGAFQRKEGVRPELGRVFPVQGRSSESIEFNRPWQACEQKECTIWY